MRPSTIWVITLLLLGAFASGCSSSSGSDPDNPTGSSNTPSSEIIISTYRMRPLRSHEFYYLWFKYSDDSSWRRVSLLEVKSINTDDSVFIVLHPKLPKQIDSLQQVLVDLEIDTTTNQPTLPLWQGSATSVGNKTVLAELDPRHLGNFSSLNSSLVFTSPSADTTAYKREVYLSSYDGGKFVPSLSSLPPPPTGWKYALWAVDSNFTPIQSVFYGSFTSASGNDSYTYNDTLIDNLPYPGGATLSPMDRPSGSIMVTLEPQWYGNDVRKHGPSPFSLLRFDRFRYISSDVNYLMSNVSTYGIPSGKIKIRQL